MLKKLRIWPILAGIFLAIVIYLIGQGFPVVREALLSLSYVGTFIAGMLYVYTYTAFPATALLLIFAKAQNLWLAGTIATCGAVFGDLMVFSLFRSAKRFDAGDGKKKSRYEDFINKMEHAMPASLRNTPLIILVIFLYISPLPDEFADFVLARTKRITTKTFLVTIYILNGIGIFLVLLLGKAY